MFFEDIRFIRQVVVGISFCRTLQFWWGKSTKALKENASFSCIPGLKTVVVTLKISEVYSGFKCFFSWKVKNCHLNPQFHLCLDVVGICVTKSRKVGNWFFLQKKKLFRHFKEVSTVHARYNQPLSTNHSRGRIFKKKRPEK